SPNPKASPPNTYVDATGPRVALAFFTFRLRPPLPRDHDISQNNCKKQSARIDEAGGKERRARINRQERRCQLMMQRPLTHPRQTAGLEPLAKQKGSGCRWG